MNIVVWLKLWAVEQKLNFGGFGRYNRYRRWCLERNAKTPKEKLVIAKEVLDGPGVTVIEAQANELFLRQNKKPTREDPLPRVVTTPPVDGQPSKGRKPA